MSFSGFLLFFWQKQGDFYYEKKDFNFMLSFCHFGAKTGLEPLYYLYLILIK